MAAVWEHVVCCIRPWPCSVILRACALSGQHPFLPCTTCGCVALLSAHTHLPARLPSTAVAVDAYCLLHRGAYTCSRELVEGEPTDRHVAYCMSRIDLLTSAGVTPLVVFDGGRLPNKQDEERSRERSREENRARARALWAAGNKAAAMECYQRAVDISPAHAKQFVEVGARLETAPACMPACLLLQHHDASCTCWVLG